MRNLWQVSNNLLPRRALTAVPTVRPGHLSQPWMYHQEFQDGLLWTDSAMHDKVMSYTRQDANWKERDSAGYTLADTINICVREKYNVKRKISSSLFISLCTATDNAALVNRDECDWRTYRNVTFSQRVAMSKRSHPYGLHYHLWGPQVRFS